MKGLSSRIRMLCLLIVATMLGATLTVFGPITTAQADPVCSNGAYVLGVRGSGEKINGSRVQTFQHYIMQALANEGISSSWAELGNLDGSVSQGQSPNSPNEYPAVNAAWAATMPSVYYDSVNTGVSELVTHLNDRYAGNGPRNEGPCSKETLVLGGYSQGAQVIGNALRSGQLSQAAKDHIGFTALYGDPKFNAVDASILYRAYNVGFQSNWWWVRGNDAGYHNRIKGPIGNVIPIYSRHDGILGAATPYVPEDFKGRFGSWCAASDWICSSNGNTSVHSAAYDGYWIANSTDEIAYAARIKHQQLEVGVKSAIPLYLSSAMPYRYVAWLPSESMQYATADPLNPTPPPLIHQLKRTKDNDGTNQVYAATNSAVTEGWWKPGGDGVHTKEVIHIAQDNIVGFDKTNLPEGKQAVYTAVPDGIWETWWDPQHDLQSAKIITDLTGVRQVIADNRWEGANHDQYVHRLYVLADQGPYEFWWKDGGDGIHKNLLDSIIGGVNMTSSTAPDGSYELYVATPTWAYELKWHPGQDFHHRPMINITQGDINSLSKVTAGSEERLFTGTSTGTWQGKWVGDGSPANNPEVNGKVGVISSQGMYTGNAFQIYLLTASGVTEFWYTPTNAGNGPIMTRSQGDLTSFTKFNDGAAQQVYTGTVNGQVNETYWGGGASLTTKPLFTVNR